MLPLKVKHNSHQQIENTYVIKYLYDKSRIGLPNWAGYYKISSVENLFNMLKTLHCCQQIVDYIQQMFFTID